MKYINTDCIRSSIICGAGKGIEINNMFKSPNITTVSSQQPKYLIENIFRNILLILKALANLFSLLYKTNETGNIYNAIILSMTARINNIIGPKLRNSSIAVRAAKLMLSTLHLTKTANNMNAGRLQITNMINARNPSTNILRILLAGGSVLMFFGVALIILLRYPIEIKEIIGML